MLPPLDLVKNALRRTTEALAREMTPAGRGSATPDWTELDWQLAPAAAVVHGVSPLLSTLCTWKNVQWQAFLKDQREHVEHRHRRVASLLATLDADARAASLAVVPLKGSALHALGIYAAGDRPMADIDLLVHECDAPKAIRLLQDLGYEQSFVQWKHRVFKPVTGRPIAGLGEHRDTPINIELHTRIQERLPVSTVDISAQTHLRESIPGVNPYPSNGALMSHLLLHAAGNMCGRSLRLIHLNDIHLLAARMTATDWSLLWDAGAAEGPWWALPPLSLMCRYYGDVLPESLLARLEDDCPRMLRAISRRQTLTCVSSSELWIHAFGGLEWCRSIGDMMRYLCNRVRPSKETLQERADMMRTQLWLQGQNWTTTPQYRRIFTMLTRLMPRMDTLYVVRAALKICGHPR